MRSLLVALVLALSGCAHVSAVDHAMTSSVRVTVLCDGEIVAFGSGVAVSATQVLTARHVATEACDGHLSFAVLARGGAVVYMVAEKIAETTDAARLAMTGSGLRFDGWAKRSHRKPYAGMPVWACVGTSVGMGLDFTLKSFWVSGWANWNGLETLVLSGHTVPGNSGGAAYDVDGDVIGLIVAGDPNPLDETVGLVVTELDEVWP